jgi:aspartate-semialdehyde dehydrogenase
MDELVASTRAVLDDQPFEPSVLPFPYGFNLFLHNSPWNSELRYCQEELKMVNESRKMLHMPDLRVHATCVRVPIPRTHAETLNVTFSDELSVERAYELLADAPGVTVLDDEAANRWAMPIDVAGKDDVYVSRIRKDLSLDRTLDLWVVGDQLLKGAALNAVQCAELALDCAPA